MKELKHYREKVGRILKDSENARNNDGSLYAHFINRYCKELVVPDANGEPAVPLKNFRNLPPMENIRRSRQIIQNDSGLYLPTKESVRKARNIKQKNWEEVEIREAKAIIIN